MFCNLKSFSDYAQFDAYVQFKELQSKILDQIILDAEQMDGILKKEVLRVQATSGKSKDNSQYFVV